MLADTIEVLLVEDSPTDALIVQEELIESTGVSFTVTQVERLSEALQQLQRGGYGVVLLDLSLPDSDGFDTFNRLHDAATNVPIVVLSGRADEQLAVRAVQCGAQDYLVKGHIGDQVLARAIRYAIERQRSEEALRMPSRVLESMDEGVNVVDREGTILYSNPALYEIFGYPAGSLAGRPSHLLSNLAPAESRRFLDRVLAEVDRCGSWSGETSNLRKDGSAVLLLVKITTLEFAGQKCAVAVLQDITQKKQLELQLLRAQRMEGLGRLAGGIAHDMNNILAPIMMAAPILLDGTEPGIRHRMLSTIEACAHRGAQLVKQLLFFGRGVEGQRSVMRLKDAVNEIEDIVGQTFPKRITISTVVSPTAWLVQADPTQIHQVLLNLCVNARDAIAQNGLLTISVENISLDAAGAAGNAEARPGPYVRLTVTDTGSGIAPGNIARIFDPFFTTKEIGQGTGLGLSTVLGIVKSHGGFVTLESELGSGSTFAVYLPALPEDVAALTEIGLPTPPPGRNELVMIVDDEELIRQVAGELLTQHGYQVIEAGDGAEALATFTGRADKIKLVVTDCDMPVMNGRDFITQIQQLNPRIKILIASGNGNPIRPDERGRNSSITYLAKPFTSDQLLHAVHDQLTH